MTEPQWGSYREWTLHAREHEGKAVVRRPPGRGGFDLIRARGHEPFPDPATPCLALQMLTRGPQRDGVFDCGFGRYRGPFPLWQVFVHPAYQDCEIRGDGPFEILALGVPWSAFAPLVAEAAGRKVADFGRAHAAPQRDPFLEQLLLRLWDEAEAGGPRGAAFADAALLALAAALLRLAEPGRNVPRESKGSGLAVWRLRRVLAYLEENLDRDPGLGEMAAVAGLSPGHFAAAFRRSTGEPPHRWLLRRRVERAQSLLADAGGGGMTEIALACGFATPSHFATVFRRLTGTTPSAWRRDRLL